MSTKILIAEDDPTIARLYEKLFTFEDYEVEIAGDGEAALESAHAATPTLIMLDIMMPRLNGLAALEQLKADPKLKDVPVVILTNLASQQDADSAIAKGAIRYLIKSEHDPSEVVALVKEVLSPGPKAAPAA